MFLIYGFTLEILERGDLLPIPMTHNSNIFLPTLVNNDQDFMCLQNKPNFKYKLHPSMKSGDMSPAVTCEIFRNKTFLNFQGFLLRNHLKGSLLA